MGQRWPRSATTGTESGRVFLAGVLACGLGACGEPTGPGEPDDSAGGLSVAVEVVGVTGPTLDPTDTLGQTITCGVSLRARATGVGRGRWAGAQLLFFSGADRATPLDSNPIPLDDVSGSWGGAEIGAGETQTANWSILAYAPFALQFRYQYENLVGGATGTASASFTCGPEIPPGAAPPDITSLSVQAPPAVLQPGDSLVVQYAATSAVGLWETAVILSGACEAATLFSEPLAASVARQVVVPIPAGCALGSPLAVGIVALDAGLQDRVRIFPTQLVLTDVTPPTVEPLFFPPWGAGVTTLDADYFVGDSVDLVFGAADNHDLRWLIWEVLPAGVRDSIPVSGPFAGPRLKLEVRPEWVGAIQLRFTARDAVNLTSAPVTTAPGAVVIYPSVARPSATATVSGEIRDVVIDQPRGVIYLLQSNQSRVAVLNTGTMAVTRTIPAPGGPSDFDLTPGGDSLLLVLPGLRAIGVIDLSQANPAMAVLSLGSLDSALAQGPGHIRTTANGRAFVGLGGNAAAAFRLLEINLATGVETMRSDAGDAGYVGSGILERSYDYQAMILNGGPQLLQRYESGSNTFGPRTSAIPSDILPLVDGTGQTVAIAFDLYDASFQYLRRIQSIVPINGGVPTALAPTDGHLYHVLQPWGVMRSRVSDGALVDRTRTLLVPSLMRIAPDGTMLVVVESNYGNSSRISTINLR